MQTAKKSLLAMIRTLPEDASFEDIQYRIGVVAVLHEQLADVDAGNVVSDDEARRRMAKWLTD